MTDDSRSSFLAAAMARAPEVISLAQALIAVPSPNPPGDTGPLAELVAAMLRRMVPAAVVTHHGVGTGLHNIEARLAGAGPGPILAFNGHLDTYPVNEALPWTVDPLGGEVRGDRLHGRGASDMKGGLAVAMLAFALLAERRDQWRGELLLTFACDEESMGDAGTGWMLKSVEGLARADGVIIADAGSPRVIRFGEKGFLWIEIEAEGAPAHGAHVHLGVNAIDRLRLALDAVAALRGLPVAAPAAVTAAIAAAKGVSETLAGAGEAEVLGSVTVNIGRVEGGSSPNLVPPSARAACDIRLPVGVSCDQAEAALRAGLDTLPGVSWRILRRFEPNHSDPAAAIFATLKACSEEVLGSEVAVNMRVGGSDARWFRMAGLPTAVHGPTPHNMGGADEWVSIDELKALVVVQALAAFDFLRGSGQSGGRLGS